MIEDQGKNYKNKNNGEPKEYYKTVISYLEELYKFFLTVSIKS